MNFNIDLMMKNQAHFHDFLLCEKFHSKLMQFIKLTGGRTHELFVEYFNPNFYIKIYEPHRVAIY